MNGPCTLDPAKTYRIRVFVGAAQLGFADVDVVSSGSQLKNVATDEFIGLVQGKTLPIRFRIEHGAVSVAAPGGSTPVSASGGLVTSADGRVALSIPQGALAATTPITFAPVFPAPDGAQPWAQVTDFGPTGTSFSTPVTLTLAFDPARLPAGVPATDLAIFHFDGTGWEIVPGSIVNEVDNTVSAPIAHFSYYWVGIRPNEVKMDGSPADLIVGRSTTTSAHVGYCASYSSTNCTNYPLRNYAVSWSTTNPAVMTVPNTVTYTDFEGRAVSPPITGRAPGFAAILAQSAGTSRGLGLTVLGQLGLLPRTASNVAGWNVKQTVTQSLAIPTNVNVSLRNFNSFLIVNEAGTSNYTYGGQTGGYTILAGQTQKILGVAGMNGVGVDTLVASAPGFVPDTAVITLVHGKFQLSGWPATLQAGDSAALQVTLTDQNGGLGGLAAPITLALAGTPGLVFSDGSGAIASIGVQQRTSRTFYVKAVSSGSHEITITHRDYLRYTNTLSATPAGRLDFQPRTASIVAGWSVGQRIAMTPVPLADATFSVSNLNGFLTLWENGGTTHTYGGQTTSFVMPAGATSKLFGINGRSGLGVDTLIATAPSLLPDTAIITVVQGRIRIDGWPASLRVGDSTALQLTIVDANGVPGNSVPVDFALATSPELAFSDGNAAITSINVPQRTSATVYMKAIGAGNGSVTFTHPWYITSPYSVPIAPAFVSIGVTPNPAGVAPGGALLQLTATPRDAAGNPVGGITLTWSSANTAVATVNGNGLVTGQTNGTATVTASSGGISGSATVHVGTPSISASPGSLFIPVQQGQTAQAQISITNSGGGVLAGLQAGNFSNYHNGSPAPWVTASWNTTTAPATLTVTAAPGVNIGTGVHQLRFDVWAPGVQAYTFYSINITVIAAGVTPVNATISPNPGALGFTVVRGQSSQAQITINNSGTDPLKNLSAGSFSNYYNGSPAPWVTASFNTTTAPATLTITAAPGADVPVQSHKLRFDVMSPGATNSPYTFYNIDVNVVDPPFRLASIDGAGGFTCATTVQNAAYCWGANGTVGTLGIGSSSNTSYPTPMAVVGGLSFTTVSTDASHTCALTSAGAAYCWGYGSDTRLGTGIDQGSAVPVAVAGGHVFVQIDVGDNHACAVDNLQRAYCWGYGMLGNLANTASASSRGNSSVPTLVLDGLQFLRVAAGGNFSCGIATNQLAYCWGLNSVGQLGAPSPTTYNCDPYACSLTPTAVSGGMQFLSISAGSQHACGTTTSGAVYCWGGNGDGQLGDGTTTNRAAPVLVGGVSSATQVDVGSGHSCARTGGGQIHCWGANASGQLGRGNQVGSAIAGLVSAPGLSFSRVTAGGGHSCGLTTLGVGYCWGANGSGQLGIGSVTIPRTVPTLVAVP